MNIKLDDLQLTDGLDSARMIEVIRSLPEQVKTAWKMGKKLTPALNTPVDRIVLGASGTACQGARLLAGFLGQSSRVPIHACSGYEIPASLADRNTLLIILGFDDDAIELEHQFSSGLERNCQMLVLSGGKRLSELACQHGIENQSFPLTGPERMMLPYSFFIPFALLEKYAFTGLPELDISPILEGLAKIREENDLNIPVVKNPAKRLAGQFFNRQVILFGSGCMAAVARYWKTLINTNAKAWAQVEEIPEISHSTVAGICQPEEQLLRMMTLFLASPFDHPVDQLVSDEARNVFMVEGFNTDYYRAPGRTLLESVWNAILFGEYVSYYLAMAYGVDPTPVPGIDEIRSRLANLQ